MPKLWAEGAYVLGTTMDVFCVHIRANIHMWFILNVV